MTSRITIMANEVSRNQQKVIVSYMLMRQMVGFMGIGLPIVMIVGSLLFGSTQIEPSISDYYHTPMGNVFVGMLSAIALFLFTYKGYDKVENRWATVGGICALIVAWVPCDRSFPSNVGIGVVSEHTLRGSVHFAAAVSLLLILAWFSGFRFTKSNDPKTNLTPQKRKRNLWYKRLAWVIVITMACAAAALLLELDRSFNSLIFWAELISLWAFGFSWLLKGEFLLADDED